MPYQGHYRPDPPPFIGGPQPAEPPRRVTPPAAPPDPPVGHPTRFHAIILPIILLAWQPAPPLPQTTRFLPVEAVAVPADQPPSGNRAQLWRILRAWPQRDYGRPAGSSGREAAGVPDDPPFGQRRPLSELLRAWEPLPLPAWKYVVPPIIAPVITDDPPFGNRWAKYQVELIREWHRPPLRPLWGFIVAEEGVRRDEPPYGLRTPLWPILQAWQPGPPLPARPGVLVQSGPVEPDDPPFGLRQPLWPILGTWVPGPPLPRQQPPMVVQEFVPTVNNPPFGLLTPIWPILAAWEPGPPMPWRGRFIVQEGPAVPSGPGRRLLLLMGVGR